MPYPYLDYTSDYSPINDAKSVSPNDAADLPNGCARGFMTGSSGNVTIVTANGT